MPSMRQSYSVTVPEDPPVTAFPFLKQEMRRKSSSVSGSVLVSTFCGLLINQAKVRTNGYLSSRDCVCAVVFFSKGSLASCIGVVDVVAAFLQDTNIGGYVP